MAFALTKRPEPLQIKSVPKTTTRLNSLKTHTRFFANVSQLTSAKKINQILWFALQEYRKNVKNKFAVCEKKSSMKNHTEACIPARTMEQRPDLGFNNNADLHCQATGLHGPLQTSQGLCDCLHWTRWFSGKKLWIDALTKWWNPFFNIGENGTTAAQNVTTLATQRISTLTNSEPNRACRLCRQSQICIAHNALILWFYYFFLINMRCMTPRAKAWASFLTPRIKALATLVFTQYRPTTAYPIFSGPVIGFHEKDAVKAISCIKEFRKTIQFNFTLQKKNEGL